LIFLSGDLDLAVAAVLRSRLMGVAESSTAAVVVVDLSDVLFIDAQCAGVIMAARDAVAYRGRQLRVDGLHGVPRTVFDLLGLTPLVAGPPGSRDGGRGSDGRGRRAGGVARRRSAEGTRAAG
jgi:anti-anti-sigma factor